MTGWGEQLHRLNEIARVATDVRGEDPFTFFWEFDVYQPGFRYGCEHGKRECEECDR